MSRNSAHQAIALPGFAVLITLSMAHAAAASDWEWSFTPYAWATNVSADVSINDRQAADEEIDFSDLAEDLELTAQGHFEGRNGRHGVAFTRFGQVNLRNARHADDPRPLDEESRWPATRNTSRAYLHHLVRSGETLGAMLLSEINVAYYQRLMHDIREAIAQRAFPEFYERTRADWARGDIAPRKV